MNNWTIEKQFTQHTVLASLHIYGVTGDASGNLWLSTNSGLWFFQPASDQLLQYRTQDGLYSDEFSFHSNIQASDQKLWLGTNKGLVVFDPQHIQPYPHGPRIQVQALKVNQQDFSIEGNIDELPLLTFAPDENTLSFQLCAPGNYWPQLSRIYYRLQGYSKDWQTMDNGESAEFIQVPDGRYDLQMYAMNANRIRGALRQIEIVIAPPFWKTIWFWLLVSILFGILVYGLSNFLARRKLRHQQVTFERKRALELALQSERNRIAGEMHDDLGTELTLIGLLLNDIPTQQLSGLASENLRKIEAHASKSIENMREIIWAMNSSYDNLPDLVAFIRRFVVEIFDNSDIVCKAQIPPDFPNFHISGEKRRNILLCIKECVHNILKHAQATEVSLTFYWRDRLEIRLADNGLGIDLDAVSSFGNGLNNMQQRMAAVGGRMEINNQSGTIIHFFIPVDPN
ncbi:MAG: histidine kinase, partial [Bacteroidota bacterium]